MKDKALDKKIAKLFLFFLPFRMISFLTPITGIMGMQAESFSLVFHVIGILFLLCKSKGKIIIKTKGDRLLVYFFFIIILFTAISIAMATYVLFQYGKYNGNSPYPAVFKLLLDFIQYLLILIYCKELFRILKEKEIYQCLLVSTRIVLIIGYIQVFSLFGIPGASLFLAPIQYLFNLRTYQSQIALTFYEPSWAAMFIGSVVIPLHMAAVINMSRREKHYIELLLWLPIIIMTKSTTAYILTCTALGISLIMIIAGASHVASKGFAIVLIVIGIIVINAGEYLDSILGFNFSYRLTKKVLDLGNQSTASRSIPLIGNWEIFKRFPILGCGNGLQGYFYADFISRDYYYSMILDRSTRLLLSGGFDSIPNGQLFIPAIISGYGIVGATAFFTFLWKCYKSVIKNKSQYGYWGRFYLISILPVLISGFKSEFVGIYYLWFVLSIPLAGNLSDNSQPSGEVI